MLCEQRSPGICKPTHARTLVPPSCALDSMATSQEHNDLRLASLTRDLEVLEVLRERYPTLDWQDFDAVLVHSAVNTIQNEVAVIEWNLNKQDALHEEPSDRLESSLRLINHVRFAEQINFDPIRPDFASDSLLRSTGSHIVPFRKRPEPDGYVQDVSENMDIVCCCNSLALDHSNRDSIDYDCKSLDLSSKPRISAFLR